MATLKQVARQAGVSVATASRILSGSDYPVAVDTRRKVEHVARSLDYVPNAQARGLLSGNPRTVGMLVGDVADPYFSGIVDGMHRAAAERGYLVTIINTYRDPARELEALQSLQSQRVGVAVVAGSGMTDVVYRAGLNQRLLPFVAEGRSAVVIGRHQLDVEVPRVEVDNVMAGELLGNHLRELGHRRVVILAGATSVTSTIDRVDGLLRVFGPDADVVNVAPTRDGGFGGARQVLAAAPETTAIVGTADQMAIGAMSFLRQEGYDVPGRISVAGCNDIWVCRDLTPGLTSVHLPLEEMGAAALDLGIRGQKGEVASRSLAVELVVRDSTGPVRT